LTLEIALLPWNLSALELVEEAIRG